MLSSSSGVRLINWWARKFILGLVLAAFEKNSFFKAVSATPNCAQAYHNASGPKIPKGFKRIDAHPIDNRNFENPKSLDPKQIIPFSRVDAETLVKLIPKYVYTNAQEKVGASFLQPLKKLGAWRSKTIFMHGTSPEALNSIEMGTIHLTPGWGDVDAGFFLDATGLIAPSYQRRGGSIAQFFVDPETPSIAWGRRLTREFAEWLKDKETQKILKKEMPEFFRMVSKSRPPGRISRDNLARALGARVLVNQTNYGGSSFTEIVVLDPTAVHGIRR